MAATQCEMEHGKVVENEEVGEGREMGEEVREMGILQVDAQGGGTALGRDDWTK